MTTYIGGQFVVGNVYTIATTGGTSFTSIGASSNSVGVTFQATGTGVGITGTAYGTDILPFATGGVAGSSGSPNVLSQSDYLTFLATLTGDSWAVGQIPSAQQLNKILRQPSFVAAGLSSWLVSQGISVPDDGNLLNFISEFNGALINAIQGIKAPGIAKAWAFFNVGSGTITNLQSFGISSITRTGAGLYTVSISAGVLTSSNYTIATSAWDNHDTNTNTVSVDDTVSTPQSTSTLYLVHNTSGIGATEAFGLSFVIFGN